AGALAQRRMAAVASDRQLSADFEFALRRPGAQPDDAAALFDEIGRLRLHPQIEPRILLAMVGEEIQEVPLRHQRDKFAMYRQRVEITDGDAVGADLHADVVNLRMRQ